jgi:hypothetical protein
MAAGLKGRVVLGAGIVASLLFASRSGAQFIGPPPGGPSFAAVALNGSQVPGEPSGVDYNGFGNPVYAGSGVYGFEAGLMGTGITSGVNDSAIFLGSPVSLLPAVQKGAPAPGTTGAVFTFFSAPGVAANNNFAFFGELGGGDVNGTTNSSGIWGGTPGNLSLIFRKGGAAGGTSGASYSSFGDPVISDNGLVAAEVNLTGGDVSGSTNNGAIYTATANSVNLIARKGSAVPGLGSDLFGFLGSPSISPNGIVAWEGGLSGGDVSGTTNNAAIFTAAPANPVTVAVRKGVTVAPGTVGGDVYSFLGDPDVNASGQIAFYANVTGGDAVAGVNDEGVWAGPANSLSLIARRGEMAPDTIDMFNSFQDPIIGPDGTTAFISTLTGSDVVTGSGGNSVGLFAGTGDDLQLIVRQGEGFAVDPSNPNSGIKDVAGIDLVDDSSGVVAYYLDFTDGSSGEYLSTVSSVPEPATGMGILAAGMVLMGRRGGMARRIG